MTDRWSIPPAALAVHLSIGQAYALSVFNLPMSQLVGVTKSAPGDWGLGTTVWIFNIAFFFLGVSAAIFGRWLERVGPRRAMLVAAACFSSGFFVSAIGVRAHVIELVYAGYGVLGGVGLGLGYIAPVSTLIKWFPDRPGMATGLAIMGFGGGAMVGAPLAVGLMERFRSPTSVGVWETFLVMGAIYGALMLFGAATVRLPREGEVPRATTARVPPGPSLTAREAIKRRDFWLVWVVLFANVTAGIGLLSQASPMVQDLFAGRIGPVAASGFVGLLSLFNLAGRLGWSSASDRLGRKTTYAIYLGLGMALYLVIPVVARLGSVAAFVAVVAILMTMYGGGFATVPAYLRDLFGTREVGAIHGRLLTAWSTAALVGPSLVTYLREAAIARGAGGAEAYALTTRLFAGLLTVGFIANLFVRRSKPVEVAGPVTAVTPTTQTRSPRTARGWLALALRWMVVLIPLGWGVASTAAKAAALFR